MIASEQDKEGEPPILSRLGALASMFKGQAIFSYMLDTDIPDVLAFFDLSVADLPAIAAHDPGLDARYKSSELATSSSSAGLIDSDDLHEFVHDVIEGRVQRDLRSESEPPAPADTSIWGTHSFASDEEEENEEGEDYEENEKNVGLSVSKEASQPQVLVGANVVPRVQSRHRDVLLLLHHGKAHKLRAEMNYWLGLWRQDTCGDCKD